MSDQPDEALGVLRGIWAAEGQTLDLDEDCGTKSCKRMADINFDGLAGEDEVTDAAALRAQLALALELRLPGRPQVAVGPGHAVEADV